MENTIKTDATSIKNTTLSDFSAADTKIQEIKISTTSLIIAGGTIVSAIFIYILLSQSNTTNTNTTTDVSTAGSTGGYGIYFLLGSIIIIIYLLYKYKINLWTDADEDVRSVEKEIKQIINPIENIVREKQVFHIPSNTYTYTDAKAVCTAYGSELASYNEISDAFGKGADWCSYGWSEGQMAFFPTQEEKWNDLQKVKGHEHDCGRPGINGGYIANPNVRFGANCFGYKPVITLEDSANMSNRPLYHKTSEEIKFDSKVSYYKNKLKDILVAPFNNSSWSEGV
jgi:uncharacterized protein YggT (Ycf19 family)